jgi:MarR family transcriptional regulator, organic hydroperoxide resistance regulator
VPVPGSLFESDPQLMPLHRLLARAGQAVGRYSRRTIAAHGLTVTALGVLGVLADAEAVSHRELSGRLGVAPATLTPVVDALEAAGELLRERDRDDRRVVRLRTTPRGRERLAAAHDDVVRRLQAGLPDPAPQDAEIIRRYLLAVLAATADAESEIW